MDGTWHELTMGSPKRGVLSSLKIREVKVQGDETTEVRV